MRTLIVSNDRRGGHPLNNYQRKIEQMMADGRIAPGEVNHVFIGHDNWCESFQGSFCNCDPDVRVVRHDAKAEALSGSPPVERDEP